MSITDEPGAHGRDDHDNHRRKMSRRRREAAKGKKRAFLPDFHDLERRMMPATFMVTSAADSGANTLRQAILNSNATPGANNIDFSLPGSGVQTISLLSVLPAITNPALVDGWSQGGLTYTGAPLVEINGAAAGSGATGLDFAAGSAGSTARGLVVSAFSGAGIEVSSNNDLVEGCYIGLNAAGTAALANGGDGILINSGASDATIGGTAAGARNVISGNSGDGVEITGTGSSGNVVSGNLVGTNAAGTAAVANHAGVEIDSGATGNLIGASGTSSVTDPLERNIISGNSFAGVWLTGTGTDNNVVAGNYIGTNAAGTGAVGNGSVVVFDPFGAGITGGVVIQGGAADNLVGTSGHSTDDAGERNVISGNAHDGVDIYGSGTGGNVVAGNLIGTNAAATAALSQRIWRRFGGGHVDQLDWRQHELRGRSRRPVKRHLGQFGWRHWHLRCVRKRRVRQSHRHQCDRDRCAGQRRWFANRRFVREPGGNLGPRRLQRCPRAQRDCRECVWNHHLDGCIR